MSMQERITEEIRVALARRKMSASELARRAGWGQGYIARRMDGRAPMSVDDLSAIAEVLGVEISDLIPDLAAFARLAVLEDFARWVVSLDDDPNSAGRQTRRTVNLTQIIGRARVALGETEG